MNIRRLQNLVENSKISKSELAEASGITRMTLDNILAGKDAKISTIEKLSIALGTTVGYLFDENSPSAVNNGTNNGNIAGRDITDSPQLAELHSVIAQQQKTISELSATIAKLVK